MRRFWIFTAVAMLAVGVGTFLAFRADPPAPVEAAPSTPRAETPVPQAAAQPPVPMSPPDAVAETSTPSCSSDEEFLDYRRGRARQSIPAIYEGIGTQLDLTPPENARLLDLLVEQSAQRQMPLALLCGDETTARRARDAMTVHHRAEIVALLGERRMPAFNQYEALVVSRTEVHFMSDHLRRSHLPLGEGQRSRLLDIFLRVDALPPPPLRTRGQSADSFRRELETWMDQNDQRLLDGARQVLDADQMREYASALQERRGNDVSSRMMEAGIATDESP